MQRKMCIWMIGFCIVLPFFMVFASALSETTLKSTVPQTVFMEVNLSGNGYVEIDGKTINKTQTIEVLRHSSVRISFFPDRQNQLEAFWIDGTERTAEVENLKITAVLQGKDMQINIAFSKKHKPISTENPATGDSIGKHMLLSGALLLALVCIVNYGRNADKKRSNQP